MPTQITVIGAGVIGLTTAIVLQSQPDVVVTIIAEYIAGQENVRWTSPWAGAHFRSTAGKDKRLQRYDADTFKTFWDMKDSEPDAGIMVLESVEYFDSRPPASELWYRDLMPEFRELRKDELPKGAVYGVRYLTFSVPPVTYLPYLMNKFYAAGGKLINKRIMHIDQIIKITNAPDVVVNCTGIGARFLGGVEDTSVYPTRGQTVLVRAPNIKRTVSRIGEDYISYTIPRSDGNVILGGIQHPNDWQEEPDSEINQSIIKRCAEMEPLLGRVNALEVLSYNVGFRPSRRGGTRVQSEWREGNKGRSVLFQSCYGHGGQGYQSSWGSAFAAVRNIAIELGKKDWKVDGINPSVMASKL